MNTPLVLTPSPALRPLVALCAAASLLFAPSGAAYAAGGDLDETFGAGGLALVNTTGSTPSTSDADMIRAMAVQTDGKIVAVGHRGFPGSPTSIDFRFLRYNMDGSLDGTFGPDQTGIVTAAYSMAADHVFDIAIQSDGKIVAAGYSGGRMLAVRLNADGSLDPVFGTGGYATVANAVCYGLALQSDGKIVLAGESNGRFAVARLLENGALDPSLGSGGTVTVAPGSGVTVRAKDVALQTIGTEERIVLAGGFQKGKGVSFGMMRLRPSGAVDTSFGSSGVVETAVASADTIFAVALDGSNRIVAAGNFGPAKGAKTGRDFGMIRYLQNGQIDATFGTGGKQRTDFSGFDDNAQSVVIQADGKIVLSGNAGNSSNMDMGIARYDASGALDPTFGYAGRVQLDLFGRSGFAYAAALQTVTNPDLTTRERILVGGGFDTGAGYDTVVAAFEE